MIKVDACWRDADYAPRNRKFVVWGGGGLRVALRDAHGQWRAPSGLPTDSPRFYLDNLETPVAIEQRKAGRSLTSDGPAR